MGKQRENVSKMDFGHYEVNAEDTLR